MDQISTLNNQEFVNNNLRTPGRLQPNQNALQWTFLVPEKKKKREEKTYFNHSLMRNVFGFL